MSIRTTKLVNNKRNQYLTPAIICIDSKRIKPTLHKPINISPKTSKQMIPSSRICTIKRSGIETTISMQKSRSQHDEDEENFNGNDLFVCLCCGGAAC